MSDNTAKVRANTVVIEPTVHEVHSDDYVQPMVEEPISVRNSNETQPFREGVFNPYGNGQTQFFKRGTDGNYLRQTHIETAVEESINTSKKNETKPFMEGSFNPYGNGQTEFFNGQPNGWYLKQAQIDTIISMMGSGSTQTQIDVYIQQCFNDNYIQPPTLTPINDSIVKPTPMVPNDQVGNDIFASYDFDLIIYDPLQHGYAFLSPIPPFPYLKIRKIEIDVSFSTTWTGSNKRIVMDFGVWVGEDPVDPNAPILPPGIANGSQSYLTNTPTIYAGQRKRIVHTDAAEAKDMRVERFSMDWPGTASTLKRYYVNIFSKIYTNFGGLYSGGTVNVRFIGDFSKDVRITDVDISAQASLLKTDPSTVTQNVAITNTPLQVLVTNNNTDSIPVTIENSIQVTGDVSAIIKDVALINGFQTNSLAVLGYAKVDPIITNKYDHTTKEPNDKWDKIDNMFLVLVELPDTMKNIQLEDESETIISDTEVDEIQEVKRFRGKKKSEQGRKDKEALNEKNNIPPVSKDDILDKKEKDIELRERRKNLWAQASKKGKAMSQLTESDKIDRLVTMYYAMAKNLTSQPSKYFLKVMLYHANLSYLIDCTQEIMTYADLLSLVLFMKLDNMPQDGGVWPQFDNYTNFCRSKDILLFGSIDSVYNPSGKFVDIMPREDTHIPITKYSHLGKEPNDNEFDNEPEQDIINVEGDLVNKEENVQSGNEITMSPEPSNITSNTEYVDFIRSMYPQKVEDLEGFLTQKGDLEQHIMKAISREIEQENPARAVIDQYLKSINREASTMDKASTYIANLLGHTNFLGPGYFGGEFSTFKDLDTFMDKFLVPPTSLEDSIYKNHDLMASIHSRPGALETLNDMMVKYIDQLPHATLQARLARSAIATLGDAYGKYAMDHGAAAYQNKDHINPIVIDHEEKILPNEIVRQIIEEVKSPDIINDDMSELDKLLLLRKMNNRRRIFGPTNREMHAMNGNTVSITEVNAILKKFFSDFARSDIDLPSLTGFAVSTSTNVFPNYDQLYWLNYLAYRSSPGVEKLIDTANKVDIPIDGFTGFPEAWNIDSFVSFDPVAGVGPALTSGLIARPFEEMEESDISKVLSTLRTNTPIVSQSTNIGIWAVTRDAQAKSPHNESDSMTVGSSSMMLAKIWATLDTFSATSEICPTWNKFDGFYTTPANRVININPGLFPTIPIANITINYWAMTQQEAVINLYSDTQPLVAAYGDRQKAVFINISTELLTNAERGALALTICSEIPFPAFHTQKTAQIISDAQNAGVDYDSVIIQSLIDNGKNNIQDIGGQNILTVVFVLTSLAPTIQGVGFNYDFTVPFGPLAINSRVNNPFNVAGVPIPDAGTLLASLQIIANGFGMNSQRVAENHWLTKYGTPREIQRAFFHYTMMKTRFVNSATVNTSNTTNGAFQKNVEGGLSDRPLDANSSMITNGVLIGDIRNTFRSRNMLGVYCEDIEPTKGYFYSSMPYKYKLALATRVRAPVEGWLSISNLRPLTTEQRFIHALEVGTAIACLFDTVTSMIGLSNTMYYQLEGAVQIGANETTMLDAFQDDVFSFLGLGELYIRNNTRWDLNQQIGGNISDTYAIPTMIVPSSMRLFPFYKARELQDKRSVADIIKIGPRLELIPFNITVNGAVVGPAGLAISSVGTPVDMQKFSDVWQPNIVLAGLKPFPRYGLANTRRTFLVNPDTKTAYYVYNPFVMPSGRDYYTPLITHLAGALIPKSSMNLAYIDICRPYQSTPDTNKDTLQVAMSNTMVNIVSSPTMRVFQSNQNDNIAQNVIDAAEYVVENPRLKKYVSKSPSIEASSEDSKNV